MKIRSFEKSDLASILAIQAKCPLAAPWVETDYQRLGMSHHGIILAAELEMATTPKVVGFAVFHRIIDEAELLNLAVDPEHQQQGVARALLENARERLRKMGTKRVFLEVRPSNKPALELYYSMGFGLHSNRKGYYQNPPEDAYILCLQIFALATVSSTAQS